MARKPLHKRNIRKLQNSKGSYVITLPVELVRKFKWKERQKLVVEEYGAHKIIIRDWKE